MLTDKQLARSRELALTLAGIELFERHREVLARRSRRAGLPEAGLDQLLAGAAQGEPDACQRFAGLVTTKFTGFFRHPLHFQRAAAHALRPTKRRGWTCLWSAGTATGEETYSLAMALLEAAGPDGRAAEILATEETASPGATTDAARLADARVLLAEDNENNQQIAGELLEGAATSVKVLPYGREAAEALANGPQPTPFDVVLMDLQMPEMDSYQATARLRAAPRFAGLPIIAMTTHAAIEESQRRLAAGMKDLPKG